MPLVLAQILKHSEFPVDSYRMVQSRELTQVRMAREAKGLEPCKVPCADAQLDKEYYLGAGTGDYGCSVCGASYFSADEYDAWRVARTKRPPST